MKSISFAKALTLGCLMTLALPIACGDDDDGGGGGGGTAGKGGAGGSGEAGEAGKGTGNTGNTAGDGGAGGGPVVIPGTSDKSKTIECTGASAGGAGGGGGADGGGECVSTKTKLPTLFIDPCCTADGDACGVDTSFLVLLGTGFPDKCQHKAQPSIPDPDGVCGDSMGAVLPFNGAMVNVNGFKGCCRAATGTCGVMMDSIMTKELGEFTAPGLGCVDSAPFTGKPGAACGDTGSGGAGGGGGAGGSDAGAAGATNGGVPPT